MDALSRFSKVQVIFLVVAAGVWLVKSSAPPASVETPVFIILFAGMFVQGYYFCQLGLAFEREEGRLKAFSTLIYLSLILLASWIFSIDNASETTRFLGSQVLAPAVVSALILFARLMSLLIGTLKKHLRGREPL